MRLSILVFSLLSSIYLFNSHFDNKNLIKIYEISVSKIYKVDQQQSNTIIASSISPGFNGFNATACFVNAIKSATSGDTVIIDYKAGTTGVWNIEGRHPNWFDGKRGVDRVAENITIIFEQGVTLKAIDQSYDHSSGLDMLFRLENVTGWKIFGYGARFVMNNAVLPKGEFRNAIALYDCKDVLFEGLTVDGSAGDGIFIGTRTPTGFSKNITVRNMIFENHRRQGITITSAQDILVENVKFNCTWGRRPTSGLDIEPDYVTQRLTGIKFKNVEFAHNGYTGILFALSKLDNTAIPIDAELDGIYIRENWQEQGDLDPKYKKAAIVMGLGGGGGNALQGLVRFNNVLIKNERFDGIYTLKHHDAYQLVFNNLVIENVGYDNVSAAQHAIHTSRYNYDSPTPAVGNIGFNGLLIREERNMPFWQLEGDSNDGWSIDNFNINNALIISPYANERGINNTTNAEKGFGTSLNYKMVNNIPSNILNIKSNGSEVQRGSQSFFTVSRTTPDLSYPLAVEYEISGTADNMDDYDLLHGYVIIPANKTSIDIPVNARAKKDDDETLTITLRKTPNYSLGDSMEQTINIISQ